MAGLSKYCTNIWIVSFQVLGLCPFRVIKHTHADTQCSKIASTHVGTNMLFSLPSQSIPSIKLKDAEVTIDLSVVLALELACALDSALATLLTPKGLLAPPHPITLWRRGGGRERLKTGEQPSYMSL